MLVYLDLIFLYTFIYPLFMSIFWIIGALIFQYQFKKKIKIKRKNSSSFEEEFFTVVIPVYNEEEFIISNLEKTLKLNYSNYKILVIDDFSTDNSADLISNFAQQHENIESVNLKYNHGKANVLNYALDILEGDYFLCLDSDASLEPDALSEFNMEIKTSSIDLSAITGSPKLFNSDINTTRRIQQLEYRSIIGMIKRAQSVIFKNIMTVSGVCTLYKIEDIKLIGGFNPNVAAEDIDISWKLEKKGLHLGYLPTAIVFMHSPDHINALILQRKRWALGGLQTVTRNLNILFHKKCWAQKMFIFEAFLSSLWVFSYIITTLYILSRVLFYYPTSSEITLYILPTLVLFFTSLTLLSIAYSIDYGFKEPFGIFLKNFAIYPIVYWIIMPLSFVLAFFSFVFDKNSHGKWRSNAEKNVRKYSLYAYMFDFIFILILTYFTQDILVIIFQELNLQDQIQIVFFAIYILIYFFILDVFFFKRGGKTPGFIVFGLELSHKYTIKNSIFNPIFIIVIAYIINVLYHAYLLHLDPTVTDIYFNIYTGIVFYNKISILLLIIFMLDENTTRILAKFRKNEYINE